MGRWVPVSSKGTGPWTSRRWNRGQGSGNGVDDREERCVGSETGDNQWWDLSGVA